FRAVQTRNLWNRAGEGFGQIPISPQNLTFVFMWIPPRSSRNRYPHREMGTKLLQSNTEMGLRAFSGNTVWEYSVLRQVP
ncbi:MAG: hypothetical protein VXA39_14790, partial [Deltaproteobacteria bacterium]